MIFNSLYKINISLVGVRTQRSSDPSPLGIVGSVQLNWAQTIDIYEESGVKQRGRAYPDDKNTRRMVRVPS